MRRYQNITRFSNSLLTDVGHCFDIFHPIDYQYTLTSRLRFTFTGKERDEETGYGYFGARYMDHEMMTMWLSVDPMTDKYPSISPYAYCNWNPVKLVDPDGNEAWKPDYDGNLIAEQGDNAVTLAKFMNASVSEAEGLLKSQGYSTDVAAGSKVKIDNVYTCNLAAHGSLPGKDERLYYNCWGSAIAGSQGTEIDVGVGISCPIQFDNTLNNDYSGIDMSEAVFGQMVIRFAESNPYSDPRFDRAVSVGCAKRGNPNEAGTASHGAVYYGTSQDGTIYVYSKNGWVTPPRIMRLQDVTALYGSVHGIGNNTGFYQKK